MSIWTIVWKFQGFSATRILREINLSVILKPQKLPFLTIWEALIPKKSKSKDSKIIKTAVFDLLKSDKSDFT